MSSIESPTYNLSKFFANIINKILGKTEFHVKDSWDFHKFIKEKTIPSNYKIISLDVVSLYTNIPTNLALECINERWDEIKIYTKIPKMNLLKE